MGVMVKQHRVTLVQAPVLSEWSGKRIVDYNFSYDNCNRYYRFINGRALIGYGYYS